MILKNKNGMTMVEIIVGIVIFAIITTATAAVIAPMLRIYIKANELAEYNTLLDNVANQIISDLSGSTAPPVIGADTISITIDKPNDVVFTVEDGVLKRNGREVYAKQFYKKMGITITCAPESGDFGVAYVLTVTLSNNGDTSISREYAVRPLALDANQYNKS